MIHGKRGKELQGRTKITNPTLKCPGDTQLLRVLGLASKSTHLNFGLTWGQVVTCCFKCRCDNFKVILLFRAVLDAFIAISEDLNLKVSRGSIPRVRIPDVSVREQKNAFRYCLNPRLALLK